MAAAAVSMATASTIVYTTNTNPNITRPRRSFPGNAAAKPLIPRIGVRKLRSFLERRVEDCYRRNVASIVPLLQNELRETELQRSTTIQELEALSMERYQTVATHHTKHHSTPNIHSSCKRLAALGTTCHPTQRTPLLTPT